MIYSYQGEFKFQLVQPYYNILLARIKQFNLYNYIEIKNDFLSFSKCEDNWNTQLSIVLDLLNFINKYGKLTIIKPILVFQNNLSDPYIRIFTYNEILFLYKINKNTFKEEVAELNIAFKQAKKNSRYRILYLSDYIIPKNEARKIVFDEIETPLFEPFMKQKLHIKEKLYKETSKNVLLPNGEMTSPCSQCIFILKNIMKKGCSDCSPIMNKKKRL